jgi:hypothetical protein
LALTTAFSGAAPRVDYFYFVQRQVFAGDDVDLGVVFELEPV